MKHRKTLLILPLFLLLVFSKGYGEFREEEKMQASSISDSLVFTDEELLGKIQPSRHPAFTQISKQHASREGMFLRKEAYEAFVKMFDAAQKDGIRLIIVSATRTFEQQKNLWERKWTGKTPVNDTNLARAFSYPEERAKRVLLFSAMPGTSRHHWGTDIDINAVTDDYFTSGYGKKVYGWLSANASLYGFCQTYTAFDSLRTAGHSEEKWHWSYMPLSDQLLDEYLRRITPGHITGFQGDTLAGKMRIIETYVQGIHPQCSNQNELQTNHNK